MPSPRPIRFIARLLWPPGLGLLVLTGAQAEPLVALAREGGLAQPFVATAAPAQPDASRGAGSLFAGRTGGSLFAPSPPRSLSDVPAGRDAQAARLRDLIARAEAGRKGYNAVQYGARIPPPAAPTRMTLAEIEAWTVATPGQPHAIGRYQFIPPTLRRLVRQAKLPQTARFSPRVQDQLADALLEEAGLSRFRAGEISRRAFMRGLARIWAGLPLPSGRSYYHGYAGNKATMAWEEFDTAMGRIFPG